MGRGFRSTSRSAAARARTSAAKRPRSSTRSKASAASRAANRRFPSRRDSSANRRSINNVETLANLPLDSARGRRRVRAHRHAGFDRHAALLPFGCDRAARASTKCRTERRCGALVDLAGGVAGRHALQAILLGRRRRHASSGPRRSTMPLEFRRCARRRRDARFGRRDALRRARRSASRSLTRIARFFRDESCGQCVPCRVGTVRQEEALERISNGTAGSHGSTIWCCSTRSERAMRDASICGLGQTAANAIESAANVASDGALRRREARDDRRSS